MWTVNFQMFKLDLEKAEEPEIKLPKSTGSSIKQESSRKTSTSALLTMPKPLTVWITTNWKILKEMGIPDHLTCLLRNLYAGQEATVRTGHGSTNWFQIRKGVTECVCCCIICPSYSTSSPVTSNSKLFPISDYFSTLVQASILSFLDNWTFCLHTCVLTQ